MRTIKFPLLLKIIFGILLLFSLLREGINETFNLNIPYWLSGLFLSLFIIFWSGYTSHQAGKLKSFLTNSLLIAAIMGFMVFLQLVVLAQNPFCHSKSYLLQLNFFKSLLPKKTKGCHWQPRKQKQTFKNVTLAYKYGLLVLQPCHYLLRLPYS